MDADGTENKNLNQAFLTKIICVYPHNYLR